MGHIAVTTLRGIYALCLGVMVAATEPRGVEAVSSSSCVVSVADREGASPTLAGEYGYAGGAEQRQRLLDAIEDVIARMNVLVRPIARRRLRAANWPSDQLHLLVTDEE